MRSGDYLLLLPSAFLIIDDLSAVQPRQQHQTSRRSRWGLLEDYIAVLLLSFRHIRLYNNFHEFVVDRTKQALRFVSLHRQDHRKTTSYP